MKYCIDKYPMGSWKGQKSPGKYMDAWLHNNLENFADKIVNDMTFLGIIYSSTLEVGTGKSVMATQIGEAWTEIMNKKHGFNLQYDVNNIVWRPKDLINWSLGKEGFKKPDKYSFVLLDEWEDANYWSELGVTLRQFFRKCRQLNLFIICIIPNWFQLPLAYAVSRSVFAIDVKFNNNLDRGYFSFYNFPAKRNLYIHGKRSHNYYAAKPTFSGNFPDGYGVDEKEYRRKKYEDMVKYESENPGKLSSAQIITRTNKETVKKLLDYNPKWTLDDLAKILQVSSRTITNWKRGTGDASIPNEEEYTIETEKKEMFVDEENLETKGQKY